MSSPRTPRPAELRRLLRAVLPTAADFDAFCLDSFPEVAARFSVGMERVVRTSMLLEIEDPSGILAALEEWAPELLHRYLVETQKPAEASENPYRGIDAFEVADSSVFFGRDELSSTLWHRFEALYERKEGARLLAILGPSGSGKSSVARAGLLGMLTASPVPGPAPNRIVCMKPGERPIENLARALQSLLPSDSAVLPASRQVQTEQLLKAPEVKAEGLRRFVTDLPRIAESPLVLLVDQWEELYTLCLDSTECDLFVATLLHAVTSGRHVSVVLTLSSDFLGATQRRHPELSQIIAAQHELVPAMSVEDLRAAIVKPAARARHPFDNETVEIVLAETRGNEGALPLLEYALTRLFAGMVAGRAPLTILREMDGVGGALAGRATEVFSSLSEPDKTTARRALVRLVKLGEGTRDTRRRVKLRELCGRGEMVEHVHEVLHHFAERNARLVTLSQEGDEAVAEVTHEALLEHWADLRQWLDEGRDDRRLHDRVTEAARLWEESGRAVGRLWRSPDLDILDVYARRAGQDMSGLLWEFYERSVQHQQQEARERARTRFRLRAAVIGIAASLVLAATGWLVQRNRMAEQEARQRSEVARRHLLDAVEGYRALKEFASSHAIDPRIIIALFSESVRRDMSGDTDGAIRALHQAQSRIEAEGKQPPMMLGTGRRHSTEELVTGQLAEILLHHGRQTEALAVLRMARLRSLLAFQLDARFAALTENDRTRWEAAIREFRKNRTEIDQLMTDEMLSPLEELASIKESRMLREEYNILIIDRALPSVRIGQELNSSLSTPQDGDLFLMYYPWQDGWIGFAYSRAGIVKTQHLAPFVVGMPADELAYRLLSPFEAQISIAKKIRIIASGDAAKIDFHALPWHGNALIARVPVEYSLDLPVVEAVAGSPPAECALVVADLAGRSPNAQKTLPIVVSHLNPHWPLIYTASAAHGLKKWHNGLLTTPGTEQEPSVEQQIRSRLEQCDLFFYDGFSDIKDEEGLQTELPGADKILLTTSDLLAMSRVPRFVVLLGPWLSRQGIEGLGLMQSFLARRCNAVVIAGRVLSDRFAGKAAEALFTGSMPSRTVDLAETLRHAQLLLRQQGEPEWASLRVFVR